MVTTGLVVLSYNHPEHTAQCLRSCEHFLGPKILVHNGSNLNNEQSLRAQFPHWQHLSLPHNRGYSGGANAGLRQAFALGTEWVIFLTNDCLLENVPQIDAPPGIILPQILFRNSGQTDSVGGLFDCLKAKLSHCKRVDEFQESWRYKKYVPGSAFAIHSQAFASTGGFNENYNTYWEDVEFSLRLKQLGYVLTADPSWRLRHKVGKTCRKDPFYTIYLYNKNRLRCVLRNNPIYLWPINFCYIGAAYLSSFLRLVRQRRYQDLRLLLKSLSS